MASGIAQPLEKQFKMLLSMQPQEILQSSAPEFLKIAALEQRNKAAQPPAQPPQGTVADKVVQQSMSPPGNVGLPSVLPTPPRAPMSPEATPTPPMPSQLAINQGVGGLPADMTMASGGIVSFAEGGRGAEKRRELEERTEETKRFLRETGELSPSLMDRILSAPTEQYLPVPIFEEDVYGRVNQFDENRLEKEKEEALGLNAPEMTSADMYYATPEAFRYQKDLPVNKPPKAPTIEDLASRFEIGVGGSASGMGAVPVIPDVAPLFPKRKPYELKEEFDYAKEREEAIKGIGGLPDFFGSQRKAIEAQTKDLQELQRMGTADALVSAGQSIANAYDPYGRPQTLIGALTEGLGAFTQSRQGTNKEVRAEKRALQALESKLAEAEYAEKRGDVDAAVKARADAVALKNSLGIKDTDAENAYILAKAKAQADSNAKQAELAAKYAIAGAKESGADRRAMLRAAAMMGGSGSGAMTRDQYEKNVKATTDELFEGYKELIKKDIENIIKQNGTITQEGARNIHDRYYLAARAQAENIVQGSIQRNNRPTLGATLESE